MFDFIREFTNKKGEELVDFVLQYFYALSGFIQALVIIAVAFLTLIGLIAIIKKSFKLIMTLGIIFLILFVLWTFVL